MLCFLSRSEERDKGWRIDNKLFFYEQGAISVRTFHNKNISKDQIRSLEYISIFDTFQRPRNIIRGEESQGPCLKRRHQMNTASFLMKRMTFSRTRMMMMLFGTIDFVRIKYFISHNRSLLP